MNQKWTKRKFNQDQNEMTNKLAKFDQKWPNKGHQQPKSNTPIQMWSNDESRRVV